MEQVLIDLSSKYPVIASVLMVIGVLRSVFKPLMSFLRTFVLATPSEKDNSILDKFEGSKFYAGIIYVVDWFTSIKLPGAK